MSAEEKEVRRQEVLKNVLPSHRTLIEYLMNKRNFEELKAQTPNCGMFYEAALERWIASVQIQQCTGGLNGMVLNDDPVLSMVLKATDPSQHRAIRQYFNDGDYASLEMIAQGLSLAIQDALFVWNQKKPARKLRAHSIPPPPNNQNVTNGPTNDANNIGGAAAFQSSSTETPLVQTQSKKIAGKWAKIITPGYNALQQAIAIFQQAEKHHNCIFVLDPYEGQRNPARYRVLADTQEAILVVNQLALSVLSTTQNEVWYINDANLRAYIRNLPPSELVAFQRSKEVFITPDGAQIRGWTKFSARQCYIELNTKFLKGSGTTPQVPPRCEQNDNFKELLKNISTYPQEMNILLLGETGSGKSTLINGIVNYLKHGTMENAMRGGLEVAIASQFHLPGNDGESVEIRCDSTIFLTDEDTSNESEDKAQSCTQDPKAYVFCFRVNGEEKLIRFIDTPGIMDTEGAAKDELNFDKILKHITHYEELHAICVVMNSNKARLTATFKYCIDELLVHLHQDASRNILFCFTNCKDTFDSAGDSITTLRKHLKDLEEKRDVKISLTSKQQYNFDNGCFRYLCAKQKNWSFSQRDVESNTHAWNMSTRSLFRMLDRVANMDPHSVRKTLSLNNTRNLLMRLSRPLADVTRMLVYNGRHLEEERNTLNKLIATHADLSKRKIIKKMNYATKQLDYPMTVCVDGGCVRYVQDSDGHIYTEYVKQCHPHCYLTGVEAETFPNNALRHCTAMSGENCGECNCSWQSHMHIRYQLIQTMKEIENEDVKRSIENNESEQEVARKTSMALEKEIREANNAVAAIKNAASEFAIFLTKNALLAYGDSYLDYIAYLIKEERGKMMLGGSSKCFEELEKFKREYEEQVKLLQAVTVDDPSQVLTTAQADRRMKELMNLAGCKEHLREVQELELLSLNTEVSENDRIVPLENSWLLRNLP